MALLLAFILSFCVLTACFGLFINLRHVNLTWSSEIYPIKQSMPVTLTLFGGWIYGIALGVGGWRLSTVLPPLLCMGLFTALTAGLARGAVRLAAHARRQTLCRPALNHFARLPDFFGSLTDCENVRKTSNLHPSAYMGTIGGKLRSKSKSLRSKLCLL